MIVCFLANVSSVHTRRWAEYFSERGHEVHVISLIPAEIPGVRVHVIAPRFSWKPLGYSSTLLRIRALVRRIKPDILHAHYASSYGLLGAGTTWRPLIISAWGSDILQPREQSGLLRFLIARALRRADLVNSLAHHMTRTIRAMKVPTDRILTLPWGTDLSLFNADRRRKEAEEYDIISTRNLDKIYNVELLLRALPRTVEKYPKLKCLLVGDGPLRERLRDLARSLGVDSHIEWRGRQSPEEIAGLLNRSKVFVSTSFSDGNNVSLNEAMACECFPIATDIPANREWVRDGENGFLVPCDRPDVLADRIGSALESETRRSQASALNRGIIRKSADWIKNMEKMEQCYQELSKKAAE